MRRGSSVIGMAGGAPSFMVEYEVEELVGFAMRSALGEEKKKSRVGDCSHVQI
jgi:hypothetical protein